MTYNQEFRCAGSVRNDRTCMLWQLRYQHILGQWTEGILKGQHPSLCNLGIFCLKS